MAASKILILGGTTEASALCRRLAETPGAAPLLSLAGRTKNPLLPPIPVRIGGFGGIAGLVSFLAREQITHLIDATHPFAQTISRNAIAAAATARVPLLALRRPPWTAQPGDRWTIVADLATAARALGPHPRRVFLTIGQLELAPFIACQQHEFLVRSVDPPTHAPPRAIIIVARGPFAEPDEIALMQSNRIDVIVTKNSGGTATRAKLDAARHLGIDVIMVDRPMLPPCENVPDVAGAIDWLAAHAAEPRGA